MKKLAKILTMALVGAFVVSVFTACGGSKSEDKLVMATNATFPPYEYVDGDAYKGIDVEVAQAIADKLGMELDIRDVEFGSIIAGVQSGKFDMGMAGMTVTDERKQSVDFSDTYAIGIQSVIVREDSEIQSVDDISSANKIGVQQDTTGDIYSTDDYGEDSVTRFKAGTDAVQALVSGKVDCVIIDNEPAKSYVAANGGLKILDTSYAEEEYAICVKKGNDELLGKINDALKELKEDGTIDTIVAKYIK
ncbi:MAG: transporter substrate-binding domain-containing protein [Agathobacter sp.]|nr:transporter substrate-binding domain-containing protein [Agathobacter sp.]